ncbi:MAG: hypothetical protein QOG83_2973 [Alphaproteobacteria bacterium]|nr:hypothetical protein [Alphaproteobacteria bacterium]
MDSDSLKLLERVASWPQEDIDELEECARMIEAQRTGMYRPTEKEREAIEQGLAQLDRKEFVPDEVIAHAKKRYGL